MKNSKLRRILLTLACAVLLVSLSVGATLAYLTANTTVVKNTFVVGEGITIDLDEGRVYTDDDDLTDHTLFGKHVDKTKDRVEKNEYKLIPNWIYDKDPTVYVEANSGECYLFVKVENGLAGNDTIASIEADTNTIESQILQNWTKVTGAENVYYLTSGVVSTSADRQSFVVFNTFTTKNYESLTDAERAYFASAAVTIDAYAIQADGFANAEAAWAANTTNGTFNWGN